MPPKVPQSIAKKIWFEYNGTLLKALTEGDDVADATRLLFEFNKLPFSVLDIKGLRQEDSEISMTTSLDLLKDTADCPIKISLKPKQLVGSNSTAMTIRDTVLFKVRESSEKLGLEIDFVCSDFNVNDPIWSKTGGTRPSEHRAQLLKRLRGNFFEKTQTDLAPLDYSKT